MFRCSREDSCLKVEMLAVVGVGRFQAGKHTVEVQSVCVAQFVGTFFEFVYVLLFGAALEGHYRDIAVAFGRKFQDAPFKNAQQPFDEALVAFVAAPLVGYEYAV